MSTEGTYEVGKGKPSREHQWKPGQSGNPGGTVKGTVKVSNALAKLLRTNVAEQCPIVTRADAIAARLFKSSLEGDTMATREILDRTEGKVSQQLAITAQQLPTNEIVDRLVEAFTKAGIDELQSRKILLMLAENSDD